MPLILDSRPERAAGPEACRHRQAFRRARRQRRDRPRPAARGNPRAARREWRRQDHADEHPVRPLRGRRGIDRSGGAGWQAGAARTRFAAGRARCRRRHGAPAFRSRRKLDRAGKRRAWHAAARVAQSWSRCRTPEARRAHGRQWPRRAAGPACLAPLRRREAAARNSQSALSRRAHSRARRADGRAHAAGGGRPVRCAAAACGERALDHIHLAQDERSARDRGPHRGSTGRTEGRGSSGRGCRSRDAGRIDGRTGGDAEPPHAARTRRTLADAHEGDGDGCAGPRGARGGLACGACGRDRRHRRRRGERAGRPRWKSSRAR